MRSPWGCQKDIAARIRAKRADYLLGLKATSFIPTPLRSTQRASYCWSFTPAQPDRPAASVRDFCSGAYSWRDAVGELIALQAEYIAWWDALPDSLHDSATAEALQAIIELDLDALAAIAPPRGYGRD